MEIIRPMKRKGHISQTYLRRDNVVLPELYMRAKRFVSYPTSINKIFQLMAELPTDRYYISDDAAMSYIRKRMFHGEEPKFNTKERQRLYESFYNEVSTMMEQEKYKRLGLVETTVIALMRPAPCVGLSPSGIWRKYYQKQRRKQHGGF